MGINQLQTKKKNKLKKGKVSKKFFNFGFKKLEKDLGKEVKKIEKEFEEEVKEIERWVVERKKFFIKLGKIILIVILLILFLRRL